MVGGCFSLLSCLCTHVVALCLWMCLHDVEASAKTVIHKKVGDTVELSPGVSAEGVTLAFWKYGDIRLADKTEIVPVNHQFQDRLVFNLINFTLTVKKLILQDSGLFIFVYGVNDSQRPTVGINLEVHEALTEQPILSYKTIKSANGSCVVLVECKAAADVSYSITVRNQTYHESKLQYTISPQDGATTFTCTVSNVVSQMSASRRVTCEEEKPLWMWILVGAAGLLVLIIISVVVAVCCCRRRREGSDSNELTIYADISEVGPDKAPSDLKPCSLYETIDDISQLVTTGPQTVYDRVQLNRIRKTSVSPYQEVS